MGGGGGEGGLGEDGNGNTKMAETLAEIAFSCKLNQHSANGKDEYIDICIVETLVLRPS